MNINNLRIRTRLGLGYGVVLLLLIAVAALGIRGLGKANEALHHIADVNVAKIEYLDQMSESIHIVSRVMRTIALLHDEKAANLQSKKIDEAKIQYDTAFASLQKLPLDVMGKGFVEKIVEEGRAAQTVNDKFMALSKNNLDEAIKVLMDEAIPSNSKWQDTLHEFVDVQKEKNRKDEVAASEAYQTSLMFMAVFTALAIALGVVMGGMVTRSILGQLGGEPTYAVSVAGRIAQGDLTVSIDTRPNDQTSLLFAIKSMSESLANIVGKVRNGTDTINTASDEIANGNLDLSSRTEHQASSLQETASSMEELTSTVKQNANNAQEASRLAVAASRYAVEGGEVVEQVVTTMDAINESSKKIVDIISVIDSIAFQTNILALNAAVEAARAGEQGRGFAVVATEVRNLAQRSASAAKEIKLLIDDSVEKVGAGSKLVSQAGATMAQVVTSVQKVTGIIGEIADASREQTAGIDQINTAITQMDQVTQQNAALVEQAAAAAQSMQTEAGTLTQVVSVFKLGQISDVVSANLYDVRKSRHSAVKAAVVNGGLVKPPRIVVASS